MLSAAKHPEGRCSGFRLHPTGSFATLRMTFVEMQGFSQPPIHAGGFRPPPTTYRPARAS
jgi:hypothetical protein